MPSTPPTPPSPPLSPQSSVLAPPLSNPSVLSPQSSVLLFFLWLTLRLIYNALRQLVPDEAYYWVWSRHLAAGYLDHPPMIAWIIRAATNTFGTSEFSVRFGSAILIFGAMLVTLDLAKLLGQNRAAIALAAAILLLSPFTAVLGTITTPDSPSCFFSICALAAAAAACSPNRTKLWWLLFGLSLGLALLSKYTSILVAAAVGLALLCSRDGRRQLLSPWPWLAGLIAAAIFWPVVAWNRHHDWASFRFQWHHGSAADLAAPGSPINNIFQYALGQAAVYTPVLFILGLLAAVWRWRQYKSLTLPDQMILWAATLPILFFGVFAFRHRPEANWPVFAYFPLTILLVQWLADGWLQSRLHWFRIGLIVAAVAMVIGQIPEVVRLIPTRVMPTIPGPWEEMFGWRAYGRALDRIDQNAVVYCTSYENASEAAFYMDARPDVWTIATARPTAFDYFPGRPAPQSLDRLVCVTRAGTTRLPEELKDFPRITTESWQTRALGRVIRPRQFIIAERDPTTEPTQTEPTQTEPAQ